MTATKRNIDNEVSEINKVTAAGLVINLLLCGAKILAGIYGRSQAVVADGIHSLSDSATDIAVLIGARFWNMAPDSNHPYGHRKIEAVVSLFIAVALAVVGFLLGYNAIITLSIKHHVKPGILPFSAAIISIVIKEWLYRWTISVGKKIKSSALIANAWHHRSDAFSSFPVALAVAVSHYLPAWSFLDHLATVVVSLFIIKAAWSVAAEPLHDLLEAGADKELLIKIENMVLSINGVKGVHKIRSRSVSSLYFIDMHVEVEPTLNIEQGHKIATEVKRALIASDMGIIDALVHIEPYSVNSSSSSSK